MQGAAVSIISAITVIIVAAFIIFYYGLAHLLCKEKCSLTFPDNQPVPLFKTILGKSRVCTPLALSTFPSVLSFSVCPQPTLNCFSNFE